MARAHDIFVPISMRQWQDSAGRRHRSRDREGAVVAYSNNRSLPVAAPVTPPARGVHLALRGNLSILQRSDRRETIAVTL